MSRSALGHPTLALVTWLKTQILVLFSFVASKQIINTTILKTEAEFVQVQNLTFLRLNIATNMRTHSTSLTEA
jgi:hypothetical protein